MKKPLETTGQIKRITEQDQQNSGQYEPFIVRQPVNLQQRVLTGLIFALVMAVFLIPGFWVPWLILILFSLVAVLGGSEFSSAMRMSGYAHKPWVVPLCALITVFTPLIKLGFGKKEYLIWSAGWTGIAMVLPILFLSLLISLAIIIPLLRSGIESLPGSLISALGILYVSFPLLCGVLILYTLPAGWYWLITALAVPWISDTTAYFVGSSFGSHKILPHISPNKTLEGALGGLLGPVLGMMIWLPLVLAPKGEAVASPSATILLAYAVLFGLLLGAFSQLGDLFASALKRFANVKDFGHILPGHGGVLDRFDSIFFSLPLTLLLALLYFGV